MTLLTKHKEQRVAVFIDVQNMYHSARNLFNARVNFKEVVRAAVAGRKLIRSFAYVVRTKTGEEKAFFEALTKEGIETRVKDLQEFYGGAKRPIGTLVWPLTRCEHPTLWILLLSCRVTAILYLCWIT